MFYFDKTLSFSLLMLLAGFFWLVAYHLRGAWRDWRMTGDAPAFWMLAVLAAALLFGLWSAYIPGNG